MAKVILSLQARRYGFTSVMSGTGLLLTEKMEHDRENLRMRTPCLSR